MYSWNTYVGKVSVNLLDGLRVGSPCISFRRS
jgi:hypothetical protein